MQSVLVKLGDHYKKSATPQVQSGDTVRVHQKIREGNKERTQIFEGLVIRTGKMNSQTARITVRRVASGIGVEKSYLLHSPLVLKVEVVKRSKVRRNYLSYMRARTGKAARLASVDFDRETVNKLVAQDEPAAVKGQPADSSGQATATDVKQSKEENAQVQSAKVR